MAKNHSCGWPAELGRIPCRHKLPGNILANVSLSVAQEWDARWLEVEALLIELANTEEELAMLELDDEF